MKSQKASLPATVSLTGKKLEQITKKILSHQRISFTEGLYLYTHAHLPLLGELANFIKESRHGGKVFFIKNIHIEYTNLCVNRCAFCSFRSKTAKDSWDLSPETILKTIASLKEEVSEVHIVGGIHPDKDLYHWLSLFQSIKEHFPSIHIKAFTAAELAHYIEKTGKSIKEGLMLLKAAGLDSIPGGGAEIFEESCRQRLFPDKISAMRWLDIHAAAHLLGIPSNATMLYGHIETIGHRVKHLELLRKLQDKTNGFNAFIPLKFKSKNNELSYLKETNFIEDLKLFAFSRIFLDNIPHIKAYWPMLGKETAFMTLDFGVDDLDGTIMDTTAIYSKAGAIEQTPVMSGSEFVMNILSRRRKPVLRDALYNELLVLKVILAKF